MALYAQSNSIEKDNKKVWRLHMEHMIKDELALFRGEDYIIKQGIVIHQPTLDEICRYGEREYFTLIQLLTCVPADFKWQLDEAGVDYTTVNDFELFHTWLFPQLSSFDTSILFGDTDFSNFHAFVKDTQESADITLYNADKDITIDEFTYLLIVEIIRKIHGMKRNDELPGNETTKRILIEDAKEEYMRNKNREFHSQLLNHISAMINSQEFKYNYDTVWNLKIYAFLDSIKRILKIRNSQLLMQSGYSGFGINLKEVDNKQLDWLGQL